MRKLLILLLALPLFLNSQENISINVFQDVKLCLLGDDIGNDAGTINIIAQLEMQGKQQKYGYMVVYPEFEYAEIDGIYKRYSANVGYTFNRLFLDNLEANLSGGYGWIDRYSKTFFSSSLKYELVYKITDKLKVSLLGQHTHRTDLKWLWGDDVVRFSGFLGLKYNIR